MVALESAPGEIAVRLNPIEKLGALHGDIRVPRSAVRAAYVAAAPWDELRGIRAPGTGLPGVIMLGTMRGSFGADFCAVYRRKPAVVVDLDGRGFRRLILCTPDPDSDCAALDR